MGVVKRNRNRHGPGDARQDRVRLEAAPREDHFVAVGAGGLDQLLAQRRGTAADGDLRRRQSQVAGDGGAHVDGRHVRVTVHAGGGVDDGVAHGRQRPLRHLVAGQLQRARRRLAGDVRGDQAQVLAGQRAGIVGGGAAGHAGNLTRPVLCDGPWAAGSPGPQVPPGPKWAVRGLDRRVFATRRDPRLESPWCTEACQSGRMGLPAKELPVLRRAGGSNPLASATSARSSTDRASDYGSEG